MKESALGHVVTLAVCAAGAVSLGFGTAFADVPASAYVQDGLIVQYDGIENAGVGTHQADATTWTDLKGGHDIALIDGDTFGADCIKIVKGTRTTAEAVLSGYQQITIEFNARPTAMDAAGSWNAPIAKIAYVGSFGWDGRTGAISVMRPQSANSSAYNYRSYDSGSTTLANLIKAGVFKTYTAVPGYGNKDAADDPVYVNATQVAKTSGLNYDGGTRASDLNLTLGAAKTASEIRSLRIYNRVLDATDIAWNARVDSIRFRDRQQDYRYNADAGTLERRITVNCVGDGMVAVGEQTASAVEQWASVDSPGGVTLTPVPAAGCKFFLWDGELDGVTVGANGVATVTDDKPHNLVCHFVPEGHTGIRRTWSGDGDGKSWSDAANWSPAGAPAAGDYLTVGTGAYLVLTEATPELYAVTVSGMLAFTNWTTRLAAKRVTIASGGIVTVACASTDATSNRVWIACEDCTVATGGKIALDEKGFSGGLSGQAKGYGPGTINEQGQYGCSHGGIGGHCYGIGKYPILPYDSAVEPSVPGSGGKGGWGSACAGGGAVRIEATGRVTLNGSILASGKSSKNCSKGTDGVYDNPGSGGSVWITCATFAGTNGVIRAQGGGGADPRAPTYLFGIDYRSTRNAGGGRIAIHYGVGQKASDVQNVEISTAAGLCSGQNETYATMDRYRSGGDCGTVWFSDTKLLDATLGKGLSGQIAFVTNYVYSGDLVWTKGHVRFAAPGADVTVAGDLTMTNGNSRLEVGGSEYKIRTAFLDIYAGTNLNQLTVNGDVALLDGARIDIRSAAKEATSDFETWGGLVTVAGNLHVASNSSVYAWCDVIRCTAPRFVVGSLMVDEGGLMSSEARGGAGALDNTAAPGAIKTIYGYSPMGHVSSKAPYYSLAGQHFGYGGKGTGYSSSWGAPARYDTGDGQYRPQYAGTGSGSAGYGDGGAGGGVIYVESAGAVVVDGEINVDGSQTWLANTGLRNSEGGGSGGTIFLSGRTFSGGAQAKLTACGGMGVIEKDYFDKTKTTVKFGGAGAGGCIAVWAGAEYPGKMSHHRVSKTTESAAFLGTAVANGGGRFSPEELTDEVPDYAKGAPGTVWFCNVQEKGGLLLLVR